MASTFIVHVTEADFQYEVLQYSQKTPVVVDFWAEWCIPCKTLGPMLEALAEQAQGEFRLAKVDVDDNPHLAQRYNIRGIPAVKGFRDGHVVAEFTGALPEPKIIKFLEELVPSQINLQFEKGESLLKLEKWTGAEEAFHQVLKTHPRHPGALLGLAKSQLVQGQGSSALDILNEFPASHEFSAAQQLRPIANALANRESIPASGNELLDATYTRALNLIARGNLPAAMDGILSILRDDKHYRDDEAREVMVGLFEILGNENPLTRQYRTELASILY